MNKTLAAAVASVALLASAIPQTASAQRFHERDLFIENQCDSRWDDDCRDWRDNRHSWDRDQYDSWYYRHHRRSGPEDAAAAIFGFAAGALSGVIQGGPMTSHVAACDARYRSYNPETDMFRGYDGDWHYCRL
jgi:hypothetical protein